MKFHFGTPAFKHRIEMNVEFANIIKSDGSREKLSTPGRTITHDIIKLYGISTENKFIGIMLLSKVTKGICVGFEKWVFPITGKKNNERQWSKESRSVRSDR